jgi:hypothetical protein
MSAIREPLRNLWPANILWAEPKPILYQAPYAEDSFVFRCGLFPESLSAVPSHMTQKINAWQIEMLSGPPAMPLYLQELDAAMKW